MKAEAVDAALVEKAARAIHASQCCPLDKDSQCYGWPINMEEETARNALAAVLPEIQAQALKDAADSWPMAPDKVSRGYVRRWLGQRSRAARLTATTEEPTT